MRPKTDCLPQAVQQKPQNYKRAMRRYHRDPLGHVQRHASGADLVRPCLASLSTFAGEVFIEAESLTSSGGWTVVEGPAAKQASGVKMLGGAGGEKDGAARLGQGRAGKRPAGGLANNLDDERSWGKYAYLYACIIEAFYESDHHKKLTFPA